MKTALIIIDVQNDYFPHGKMELSNSLAAGDKIKDLLRLFRMKSMPIVHIQHFSVRPGASYLLPETSGADIHPSVYPIEGEKIIVKNFPNSFRKTELEDYLKSNNVSQLVIAGMMTHMCIDTTVRAAYDLGYDCLVAGDCCATKSLAINGQEVSAENVHNSFLAALNGLFSKVLKKDEIIGLLQ